MNLGSNPTRKEIIEAAKIEDSLMSFLGGIEVIAMLETDDLRSLMMTWFRLGNEATSGRVDEMRVKSNDAISSARYIIINESASGHCCFECTIIDTASGKQDYGDYWKRSMCETFDQAEAEIICDALNKHCR